MANIRCGTALKWQAFLQEISQAKNRDVTFSKAHALRTAASALFLTPLPFVLMMEEDIVSLQQATIRYPDGRLFPDVSFTVQKGQHWAFVGEGEALQTAVIEALAGVAGLSSGQRLTPFFNAMPHSHAATNSLLSPQSFIAFVSLRHSFRTLANTTDFYYQQRFNSADSEDALSVHDYLQAISPLQPNGAWTFEKVVADLQLETLLPERVIQLSNGETKRVLLAAALLRHPVLLLLHHPFAGLDAAARQTISQIITRAIQSGIAVVLTTTATEIPAGITHVAQFKNDDAITTSERAQFTVADEKPAAHIAIDEEALRALLAQQPLPYFDTIIRMTNVCITYNDHRILDNINWTVKSGQRWALTGPNGSGKSTLLSLISGDNPQAFANDIVLFDRQKGSGESIWDIKKNIGFFSPELYQYFPTDQSSLHAVESGFYDTVGLFRPSNSYTSSRALAWMQLLGVAHLSQKALRQLQPTQQRLCLLARALVKSPALLLLDEPCQGFTEKETTLFRHLIDAICRHSNVTLIYVSHYENELPRSITQHLRLRNGKQQP